MLYGSGVIVFNTYGQKEKMNEFEQCYTKLIDSLSVGNPMHYTSGSQQMCFWESNMMIQSNAINSIAFSAISNSKNI